MSLYSARDDLAKHLAQKTGYTIDSHVPSQISPPCGFIEPGEPYIVAADTYDTDEYVVTVRLWLLVEFVEGANDTATNDLDRLLKQVLTEIPSDYAVTGSGQPQPVDAHGNLAHGVHLDLSTLTTL